MLKWYADMNKISEQNLTPEYLSRLKIYALLGLPTVPLFALLFFGKLSLPAFLAVTVVTLISAVFMVTTMASKFTNRFWARDKFLDEWELQKKHHSMAFGLQVIDYIVCVLMLVVALLAAFIDIEVTFNLQHLGMIGFAIIVLSVYIRYYSCCGLFGQFMKLLTSNTCKISLQRPYRALKFPFEQGARHGPSILLPYARSDQEVWQ